MLFEKAQNLKKYIGVQEEEVSKEISDVADTMEKFNEVVDACFGMKLDPYYKHKIEEFCKKFRKLPGITFPIKFHLVEQHIVEFIEMHGDGTQGLGVWSEQAMESCHSDFKKFWSQVRLKPVIGHWHLCLLFISANPLFSLISASLGWGLC